VTGLRAGESSELLLLSVQGRIDFDARVVDDGATTWLIVEAAEAAPLAGFLDRMKFMLRVEVADVSAEWAVVGSTKTVPEWAERLVWQDPWPNVAPGGYSYATVQPADHPGFERPWFEYLIPAAGLENAVEGRQLAGVLAAEALRLAAWRPRIGAETDDKTIPHELDLLRTAVHLAKGCYKGQETIARVHNLGHPPRRLVFLQLDGSQHTLPQAGSPVMAGERKVGTVTSVAQHYEMGPVALAVIKRSVAPDEILTVLDGDEPYPAAQELIVAPDAGQVVGRQTGFLKGPRL
jgi:folate-binding protein YgfZ